MVGSGSVFRYFYGLDGLAGSCGCECDHFRINRFRLGCSHGGEEVGGFRYFFGAVAGVVNI